MKISEIDTVCFIGAGTMGCFNALMCAVGGYKAVIYDLSGEALDAAPETLKGMAAFLVEQGFFQSDDIPGALSRIAVNPDFAEAVVGADLVSESVSERLTIKRDVHRKLDEVCSPNTIITTNTSSLLVSDIEDALVLGDRFAALHSHLASALIDIVGGPRTSPRTIDVLERYVESIQGMPLVLKKENPGYVLNAMLGPLLAMAKVLVIEGLSTPEDVDRSWMLNHNAPIGPFGLMDLFGLNIIFDSWQTPKPKRAHLREKIVEFITPYIESDMLGVKTGKGFYCYPEPLYSQADFLDRPEDLSPIYEILITVVIENAIVIAQEQIAEPAQIDRAWIASFSVPNGPFAVLEEMGFDAFASIYSDLRERGLFTGDSVVRVETFLKEH
ncbi:MAG: 3-hydroxyacyl-CoA dehydrogenase NAD-binding domain-containing protein [Halioglobus sp.]